MECSICMSLLSEFPEIPLTSPTPAKKPKTQRKKLSTEKESLVVSTPCGHIFHRQCLKGWLKGSKGSCPTCRRPFSMRSTHPIFVDFKKVETEAMPSTAQVSAGAGGGSKTVHKILSEDSKQKSPGDNSKTVVSHTDDEYSELQRSLLAMKKENEALKEKFSSEKQRADANEAIAKTLQEKQSSPNSHKVPSNTTAGEPQNVGYNSPESPASPAPGGSVGGSVDNWLVASLKYWWPNDSSFQYDDEDNWGN
ncbi:unnamed protein product [Orchesella dallaii]|uniref:RING-type domain-containing protein n=1 Tax=Orchesella dallaii TaxID=48710 RepID=A0ABP1QJV2_9HEXA